MEVSNVRVNTRMRVVGWQVQPVIMADDGDNLENCPVQPQFVPAAAWKAFKGGGDEQALERIRVQVERPAAPAGETEPAAAEDGKAAS